MIEAFNGLYLKLVQFNSTRDDAISLRGILLDLNDTIAVTMTFNGNIKQANQLFQEYSKVYKMCFLLTDRSTITAIAGVRESALVSFEMIQSILEEAKDRC